MGFMDSQGATPRKYRDKADKQLENEYFYQGKPNAAYHGFFEGYREVRIPKKNGKGYTIRRVYAMPWVRMNVPDGVWIRNKLIQAGLFALAVLLYLAGSLNQISANSSPLVAIPGLFGLLGMVLTLVALLRYLIRKRNMTLWEYRSGSRRIIRCSLPSAAMLLMTAAVVLFYVLMWHREELKPGIFSAASYALGGLSLLAMMWFEEKIPYTRVDHETEYMENGVDII